jgi:hypothetical protein
MRHFELLRPCGVWDCTLLRVPTSCPSGTCMVGWPPCLLQRTALSLPSFFATVRCKYRAADLPPHLHSSPPLSSPAVAAARFTCP